MFYAAADPGTSNNAFAFSIVERIEREPAWWRVRLVRTWQGRQGAPLDVRNDVGPEVCRLALAWGCDTVMTDIHEWAGMQLAGQAHGVQMRLDNAELSESCLDVRIVTHEKRISFDQTIGPDIIRRVTRQLGAITMKDTYSGPRIVWPGEGRGHGDEARAVARALFLAKARQQAPMGRAVSVGTNSYAAQSKGGNWYPTPEY